jgi:hypothetical protein
LDLRPAPRRELGTPTPLASSRARWLGLPDLLAAFEDRGIGVSLGRVFADVSSSYC